MTTNEENAFIDDTSDAIIFLCPICHNKIQDPYSTSCYHIYCKACITENTPANCPTCQQPISIDDIKEAPSIVRSMIDRHRVMCARCGQQQIPKENFGEHIQSTCPRAIVSCPAANIKCPWKGCREQLDLHLVTCPFHSVYSIFLQLKSENQRLMEQTRQLQMYHELQYESHIQSIENIKDNQSIHVADFNDKVSKLELETQQGLIECVHHKNNIAQLEKQIALLQTQLLHSEQERERINKVVIQHENQIKQLINKHNIMAGFIGDNNPELIDRITRCENRAILLNESKLTDRDLFIVVQHAMINKQCEILNLQSNEITAHGAAILADELQMNTSLKTLLLYNNLLSDLGVAYLAEALASNATLEILELESNIITDDGASSLAELLRKNSTLTHLFLSHNQISDRGVQLIADALMDKKTALKELILDKNQLVTDESVQSLILMLKHNRTLQTLRLWNCDLTDQAKAALLDVVKSKPDFTLLC